MKKYIIIFILFFFLSSQTFGEGECEYLSKINQCIEANKTTGDGARSIEDFVCPSSTSAEEITYQIILDQKFKEVDKNIDEFITFLEENKDHYFGPNAKDHMLNGIDLIENKFSTYGEYWVQYRELCDARVPDSILQTSLSCLGGETRNIVSKDYFDSSVCIALADRKLQISSDIAYKILQLDKLQVRKDTKKEFFQKRRTKYDDLMDIMMYNLGYLERIWKGWPAKIKTGYY